MKLWQDAQPSPEMAAWITERFGIEAIAVRDLGLRVASDTAIFLAAKREEAVLVTKDSDFSDLIQRLGTPPQVIWLRCGNTSNDNLRRLFDRSLVRAVALLEQGEALVEIVEFTG